MDGYVCQTPNQVAKGTENVLYVSGDVRTWTGVVCCVRSPNAAPPNIGMADILEPFYEHVVHTYIGYHGGGSH